MSLSPSMGAKQVVYVLIYDIPTITALAYDPSPYDLRMITDLGPTRISVIQTRSGSRGAAVAPKRIKRPHFLRRILTQDTYNYPTLIILGGYGIFFQSYGPRSAVNNP